MAKWLEAVQRFNIEKGIEQKRLISHSFVLTIATIDYKKTGNC